MMKFTLIILISSMLTGCFYQSVNMSDIETATKKCAEQQSTVVSIEATFMADEKVYCSNRKTYWL